MKHVNKNVEFLSEALRTSILRGERRPGSPLRQERLARDLGVSKIPVREALQRLTAEGIANFDANRGFAVGTLTPDAAEEIYALRAVLEPLLLERAIPNLNDEDFRHAEEALEREAGLTPHGNWAFHHSLYGASGLDRGLETVRRMHIAVAPYLLLYVSEPSAADVSERQHRMLLSHCRAGKTAEASSVLGEHLRMASAELQAKLRHP